MNSFCMAAILGSHFGVYFGVTLSLLGGTWEALGAHWELDGTSLGGFWCHFGELWGSLCGALGILGATGPAPKGAKPPWGRADWAPLVIFRWLLGTFWVTLCGDLGGESQNVDRQTGAHYRQTDQTETDRQTDRVADKFPMCFPFHC